MYLKTFLPALVIFIFTSILVDRGVNSAANSNQCQSVWKFPPNCQNNCTYQLVWRFKQAEDSIEFIVTSKYAQRWTGVGFSQTRSLLNSDAIFAWIEENSRYVMMDAFLPTYNEPLSDKQQSISNISATVSPNGLISFRFTRKRNTGDAQEDLLFSDEKCLYLVYPVEGGTVDVKNRAVITSEHAPQISESPVCIRACNYKPPATVSASTTSAPTALSRPQLHFPTPSRAQTRAPALSSTQAPSSSTSLAPSISSTSSTSKAPQTSRAPPTTTTQPPTTTTSTTTTTTTTPPPPTTTTTTTSTTTTRPTTTVTPPSSTTTTTRPPPTSTTRPTSTSTTTTTSQPVVASSSPSADSSGQDEQWCVGRWSHPPNCRFLPSTPQDTLAYLQQPIDSSLNIKPLPLELSDCSYFAQWQFLEATDSIEFIIQTKTRNRWTGIGFSNSTRMANSDAIIGLIEELSGRHFIMDTWLRDHVMPDIDAQQNTEQTWGKRENGTTTVRFRRRRTTNDQHDFQFTDDSCAYFFFPTQGGSFNAISKRMHKHESIPSVSKQRICVRSCNRVADQTDSMATTTTSSTSQHEIAPEISSSSSSSPSSTTSNNSSQAPNLFLLSSSSAPSPAATNPTTSSPPDKGLDSGSSINLSPSNDLSAELDSSSSSTSASSGPNSSANPFNKLAFLSEPSLRWLAGIGCVATLLAVIVFQACFTVYKNKQAYKQNLYRQSAFKQNTYLHSAYITDAPNQNNNSDQRLHNRNHQPSTEEEEELDEVEVEEEEEIEVGEDEEIEVEDDEEFEDDMMMEGPFNYGHSRAYHGHRPHGLHPVQAHYPPNSTSNHHNPAPLLHPHHHHHHQHHHHNQAPYYQQPHHHHQQQHRAHSHYRQAINHQHQAAPMQHHHQGAHMPRVHQPSNRSQSHQQASGHHAHQQRPDSYFLPSQRRY